MERLTPSLVIATILVLASIPTALFGCLTAKNPRSFLLRWCAAIVLAITGIAVYLLNKTN